MRTFPEVRAVLAIDQAAESGVAFGELLGADVQNRVIGTTLRFVHIRDVIAQAVQLAGGPDRLAVIFEDHSKIPLSAGRKRGQATRGTSTILGMGAARGRWESLLWAAGHNERLQFRMPVHEWRGDVLGPSFAKATTERAKPAAVRWAAAWLGMREDELDHNAAEAACMLARAARTTPWRKAA